MRAPPSTIEIFEELALREPHQPAFLEEGAALDRGHVQETAETKQLQTLEQATSMSCRPAACFLVGCAALLRTVRRPMVRSKAVHPTIAAAAA
jgi:hypothetical protein